MHHSFRPVVCFALVLFASFPGQRSALAQYGEVAGPPADLAAGFETITASQAKEWLGVLAGDGFAGRGTGQSGYIRAAHWVAGKVAEFGLKPVGDGDTYFQIMPLTRRFADMSQCQITGPDGLQIDGAGNLGFVRYTQDGTVEAEVVFLSLQGSSPTLPEDLELRDRIVLYTTDTAARPRAARLIARQRPAASLQIVESEPASVPQTLFPGRRSRSTSISGSISRAAATKLAEAVGVAEGWDETANAVATGQQIGIQMRLREEKAGAPNVVALLEGSDPELRDEYIVIGAHLDHLGKRGEVYYPGADDNGSGSTAILSIARAMAANPVKPKRSVLFIWFAAEEVGLVGSRYYVDNPLLPIDKMTCMFNIDMVGRNEDQGEGDADADNEGHIHLVGSQRGETRLHDLILTANQHVGFEFELDMESVWNRSDQVNFYNQGVPVAFMFGGFHPDYHQTTDVVSKINYPKIASAAKLFYLAAYLAADHGRFKMKTAEDNQSGQ